MIKIRNIKGGFYFTKEKKEKILSYFTRSSFSNFYFYFYFSKWANKIPIAFCQKSKKGKKKEKEMKKKWFM